MKMSLAIRKVPREVKNKPMNRLRSFRERAGFTQRDMAAKLGISESYYCQLENGKRRMSLRMALAIAAILKKTPNDIFLPDDFAERQPSTGTEG